MSELDWKTNRWSEGEGSKGLDEEWSLAWGGSEYQWFASLLPRIYHFLPCNNILEISCGYGRWTKFFLPLTTNRYVGIDPTENAINHCKENFLLDKATFFQNDGVSLVLAEKYKYDLIFSFDYFVHLDMDTLRKYILQIIELLNDNGICFIHHSNFGQIVPLNSNISDHPGYIHERDQSSSAEGVKSLIEELGGKILLQELINWGSESLIDCFTLFTRKNSNYKSSLSRIINPGFMKEAEDSLNILQYYNLNFIKANNP
jgi:SAM-dependent methyltransferase